jgi:hypothetical protein
LVEPGSLSLISAIPARFNLTDPSVESSRRAALAEWIAHPQNPLTWRSIVNRVWQGHFGRGIIDSVNDIGRMGATASHPELLEWLAADFRDSGGSLKRLHRLIVTSEAYQRASQYPAAEGHTAENPDPARRSAELDADLKLLSRFPRRRLDAESLRDIVLQTAGRLDFKMGGPSVMHFKLGPPIQDTPVLDYTEFDWDQPGVNRRSIYRLVYRNIADPFMTALDFPDAAQLAPVRPFSASALQALVLWNDAFVLRQSERFAERVQDLVTDPESVVRTAVRLAWLREIKPDELQPYMAFIDRHGLPAFCRVLFNSNEFLFGN